MLNGGLLVDERKSSTEGLNLVKYTTIISHREAHEPPDSVEYIKRLLRVQNGIRVLAESGEPSISGFRRQG